MNEYCWNCFCYGVVCLVVCDYGRFCYCCVVYCVVVFCFGVGCWYCVVYCYGYVDFCYGVVGWKVYGFLGVFCFVVGVVVDLVVVECVVDVVDFDVWLEWFWCGGLCY